jgi:hypothetical protein
VEELHIELIILDDQNRFCRRIHLDTPLPLPPNGLRSLGLMKG